MKRRILPMIMAVMMILSIIQVPAWAADGDDPMETADSTELADAGGDDSNEGEPETQDGDDVAQIGDTGYPTLQAAIDAIENEGIITLLTDVSDTQISEYKQMRFYDANKTITIDLKGKTITASATEAINIHAPGLTLTIKNGTIINRTEGDYSDGIYAFYDSSDEQHQSNNLNLTLENIKLDSRTQAIAVQGNTTNSNVTLDNCVVTSDTLGIYYPPKSGTLSISDTSITAPTGVVIKGSSVEISGNTHISATGKKVDPDDYYHGDPNSSLTLTGDAIYVESGYNDRDISLKITGGTFESENGDAVRMYIKAEEVTPVERDISISGGTFSSDVSEYLADTVKGTSEGGNFIVKPLEEDDQETVAEVGGEYYKSLSAAIAAAKDGGTVTLLKDTELTSVRISKGITLDLGGKTLKLVAGSTSPVGLSFSSGSSKIINGTIQDERVVVSEGNNTAGYYMVVVNGDGTSLETSNVTMITNRPDISTNQYTYIIQLQNGSSATLNSGTVLKDQMYNGQTYETYGAVGVTVLGTNGGTTTSLTVNEGAEISTYGFAVSGNGTMHGTSITINGGEIISEISTAIYHPQDGEITINDGSAITGENAGIEIRSGELTVNGGTIQATAEKFECDPNESGTTTVGAALAIAQHTTKKDITVTINGGTFIGVKALNESNPQVNDPAPQVELSVRDGDFQGEVTTADVNNFVSGGTFSSVVKAEYCATGFVPVTTADSNGKYTVTVAENMTAKIVGANGNDVAAYENLSNAVKAVKSGQTIVLLEDVTDALPVPQVADVTYTAVDGVTVSGGMSGTVAGDLTLNGITFTQKDVYLNGKEDATVTVKDCTFSGVTAHGNKLGAFNMVTAGNLVFTGNTITGTKDAGGSTEAVGIYTQNLTDVTISDNTIGAVSGTSINVNGNKGTTTITGNELTDWASAGGNTPGRAIRLSDSGDGNVTITGNKLVNNKETLESYIKISGVEENSVDATKNYWNGKSPDAKAGDGNPLFEVADATVDGSKITSEPYFEAATMRDPEDLSNYVPPVDPDDDHGSSSSGSSSSVRRYDIEADAGRGGDISPDGRVRVRRGEDQTFRITADDGWEIYDVEVDGESVGAVSRYTFENVREDHTISATFRQTGAQTEEAQLPFLDVAEGAWYYDAVTYCYENGIMDGTSSVSFAPGMLLNRAMAAQVLYNLADGTASTAAGFPDVAASAWYADAVNWAAANGYVTGYDNGSFGPEDSLTREQLAVILYRYAGSPEPTGSLDGFTDAASASDYAVDALRWAVGEGLLTGKDGGRLDPAGTASRAELAQILARFAQM